MISQTKSCRIRSNFLFRTVVIFSDQLKTRNPPGTSFEPYPKKSPRHNGKVRDKRVLRESAGPWMGLGAVLLAESPGRSLFRSLGGFSSENDLCYADR
jgi:hypothetical protein